MYTYTLTKLKQVTKNLHNCGALSIWSDSDRWVVDVILKYHTVIDGQHPLKLVTKMPSQALQRWIEQGYYYNETANETFLLMFPVQT